MLITSIQNNQVKQWKKLHMRKFRMKTNSFLVEGFHLIEEAHKSGWEIETVIVEEGIAIPTWCNSYEVVYVTNHVFKEISQTEQPQGIAAEVKMKALPNKDDKFVLLIDAIQDPGNLGTIIRTADAAGFSKVILGKGTVDLYNDKVIRASQGSIFHIPIVQGDLIDEINALKQKGVTIWASALEGAENYREVQPSDKTAIIVGNEGAGVHPSMIQLADNVVKIPIYGKAESLNVSIAAGILMYQLRESKP